MCGIYGFVGKKNAKEMIIDGLRRMEYRGYDSWGIGVIDSEIIKVYKDIGPIGDVISKNLNLPDSRIGIGHTRWATHGGVSIKNAHPHFSSDKSFILAQNGIVENYNELKKELLNEGYKFNSETDTEVIVRIIEKEFKKDKNLINSISRAFKLLEGRNTFIILDRTEDRIIAIRNGSPLVIGLCENGDKIIASDTLSFSNQTQNVIPIEDNQMVIIDKNLIKIFNQNGNVIKIPKIQKIEKVDFEFSKDGFDHFMIKEIIEQKFTIKNAVSYSENEFNQIIKEINKCRTIYTIGAGTAGFAAKQIAYFLRKIAKKNAIDLRSYEYSSFLEHFNKNDLLIVVSQSGETADTIEAMEAIRKKGVRIISIVNMLGSTITKNSDYKFFSRSGPEICVASTKAFTAQISWGYLLSKAIVGEFNKGKKDILDLSLKIEKYLDDTLLTEIKDIAKKIKKYEHFFILGKGQNETIALEGALKLKEITYKHFEGFPAGELKHGVIALIEKNTPVITIVSEDETKNDMKNAIAEVKARGAFTISITSDNSIVSDEKIKSFDGVEVDSIVKILPFQILSYFLALELGNSPDRPRNLAKSVTVK